MPLTDTAIRAIKPSAKATKHGDGRGLYLEVSPSGGKWWRFKYRIDDKDKRISLGTYPDTSLSEARDLREDARKLVAKNIDPSAARKEEKGAAAEKRANTFEGVALAWFEKIKGDHAPGTYMRTVARIVNDVFPAIGARPISDITNHEYLAVIQKIEARGALETAHRTSWTCNQIFQYAIVKGKTTRNPAFDNRGQLKPAKKGNFPAITNPDEVAALLRAIDGYEGYIVVRTALRLAPLVFVRPGELRAAEWDCFDLEAAEWRYTVTKTKTAHIVPLSTQSIALLTEIKAVTGGGRYVFPSARADSRPMSDAAINAALRSMGIGQDKMTGHGFRAMARTILDEVLGYRPDIIEHQLAHQVKDTNGRAYNRTSHLTDRRQMMQAWANYLDKLKAGADVLRLIA
jgi:integrase